MGKKAKEHRKKVAKRNSQIEQQKKTNEKLQKQFLMDFIEREKNSGKFNNNPTLPIDTNGPIVGPVI